MDPFKVMPLWVVTKLCWGRKLPSGCCSSPASHQAYPYCRLLSPLSSTKSKKMVWGKHKDGPLQRNTPWHQASPSGLTEKWHVQFSLYLQTINILHTHAYLTFISLDPKKPGLGEQQIRKKLGDLLVLPRAPLSMYKQQIHSREMCLSKRQNATVIIHI